MTNADVLNDMLRIAKYLSQYMYNDVREAVEVIDEYIGELPSVNPQKNIVNNGTMNITL
jgi:hypothetical protein